jgi:hypothetical protein
VLALDPDQAQTTRSGSSPPALAKVARGLALESDEDEELELFRKRASLREDLGDLAGAIADHTGDMPGALADAARVWELEDETIAELAAFPDPPTFKRFDLDEA